MARQHVFISYSREDTEFVATLTRRLKKLGLPAWRDLTSLKAGDQWVLGIDDALRSAEAVILVLSPNSTRSHYVSYEWAFAMGAGIRVIPIILKKTSVPPRLRGIQFVDFTKRGKPWLRLVDALAAGRVKTMSAGEPKIRAAFELEDGKPKKVKGEYVILLSVERAPTNARRVTYRVHDESFSDPKWSEKNASDKFASWMQSYGDVLLSATIHTPSQTHRVEVTLFEALRRAHGRTRNKRIQQALRDIESH